MSVRVRVGGKAREAKQQQGRPGQWRYTYRSRATQRCVYTMYIEPGGRLQLPNLGMELRAGQRLYLSLGKDSVVMTLKPERVVLGRYLSTRIRNSTASWSMYGPRGTVRRLKDRG